MGIKTIRLILSPILDKNRMMIILLSEYDVV